MNFLRLLKPSFIADKTSRAFAGRWWPQPEWCRSFASSAESSSPTVTESDLTERVPTAEELGLPREKAFPAFAPRRGDGNAVYKLVPGRNGELQAGYNLFVDSIRRSEINWHPYDTMTKYEKHVYIAHIKAVEGRKLEYTDPIDKKTRYKTVAALIYEGKCCGEGCRHCPYELENCSPEIKKRLSYNGAYYLFEMSRHRTRPPVRGITRRTRLLVVDNSALGKEANLSGKPAYCIHVYKQGFRQKFMPTGLLGDKILVAIRGEMRKAIVVGAKVHMYDRRHGIPSTDTNNIVLLLFRTLTKIPVGTRVLAPIPSVLLKKRSDLVYSKALSLANKFF
ncbi:60S ribosomal protein L23 [Aphelenchoides bicaudatus]|nr:60S ribosomal protein L23 [Aphelenchoides bicaudatus]